jgi:prepilin signal peptidase PulO-like enzyme (type II secretory pathway)
MMLLPLALGSLAGLAAGEASRALACRHAALAWPDRVSLVLAAGAGIALSLWMTNPSDLATILVRVGLLMLLVLVLGSDMRERAVYPAVVYPAILGLAAAAPLLGTSVLDALLGGAMSGGLFGVVYLVARLRYGSGAFGEGDVSVAVLMGVVVGASRLPLALILVSSIGAGLALVAVVRAHSMRATFPYAPALSLAALGTLLLRTA